MGRGVADVGDEMKLFPFRIVAESGASEWSFSFAWECTSRRPRFRLRAASMKDNAEAAWGAGDASGNHGAAYFDDAQRQATKDAGD